MVMRANDRSSRVGRHGARLSCRDAPEAAPPGLESAGIEGDERPPARAKPGQRSPGERRPIWVSALIVAAVLLVGGVWAYTMFGREKGKTGEPGDARGALEAAGCTLQVVPGVKNKSDDSDVPTPDTISPLWNTDPPTSGPHYAIPALFGAYDTPLQLARVVHDLEHGGVYILYGSKVDQSTVEGLRRFTTQHPVGTLLAPLPRLGRTIALGAWITPAGSVHGSQRGNGVLARCSSYDAKVFRGVPRRVSVLRAERLPPSSLAPGS